MSEGRMWFRPKRYGLGSGLPIAWQGWALLGGYGAAVGALLWLAAIPPIARGRVIIATLGIVALTLVLMWISAAKTEGGWRWRWGDDD